MYDNKKIDLPLLENEYLMLYEKEEEITNGLRPSLIYCYEDNKLRKVPGGSINISKKREKDSKVIYPRNAEQSCAIDMLLDESKTVKLLTGS